MYKRIVYKNKVYIVIDKYTTIRLKTRRVKELRDLKVSLLKQDNLCERLDEYKKYRYSSIPSYGNQYCFVG
jgi:hypothetical protein